MQCAGFDVNEKYVNIETILDWLFTTRIYHLTVGVVASPIDRDEVKTDLMLANMTNNIFLPNVLTLFYPIHIETLSVIEWNPCEVQQCQWEKSIPVSQLYEMMIVMYTPVKK